MGIIKRLISAGSNTSTQHSKNSLVTATFGDKIQFGIILAIDQYFRLEFSHIHNAAGL